MALAPTLIKSTTNTHHPYYLQRAGHLFLTGYYSEHLQRTQGRQCYFPTITLGESRARSALEGESKGTIFRAQQQYQIF